MSKNKPNITFSENSVPNDMQNQNTQDQINTDDIFEVAKLARLGLNENTAKDYADDISKILKMMQTIGDVDTQGLTPLSNVHEVAHSLRADVPNSNIDRQLNQSVAPAVQDGLYLVPQVID